MIVDPDRMIKVVYLTTSSFSNVKYSFVNIIKDSPLGRWLVATILFYDDNLILIIIHFQKKNISLCENLLSVIGFGL